jgi:hypothetical protein
MKECVNCHQVKATTDFYRLSKQKSGLNPWCKVCVNEYNRAYTDANRERYQEWRRRSALRRWAKQKLGIDTDAYEGLIARAGGRCEICGRAERTTSTNGHSFMLALDHDHSTGAVRGMVCRPCNTALGCAQENPVLLRKLADYLENPPGIPLPSPELEQLKAAHREHDTFGQTKRPLTGWKQSDEARLKIAKSHLGIKSPYKGVPRSEEVKAKISATNKGQKRSDQARANMRAARLRYLDAQRQQSI